MSNDLNNICEIKTEKESMNFSIKDSFNKKHTLKLPSLSNDKRSSTTFNTRSNENNFNEIIYNDSSFYTNNNNVNDKTIPEIEEENVETEKNYDSTIKKSMPENLTQRVYSNFTLSSIRQSENTFFNDNNGDDKDLKLNLIQRNNTFRKEYKFLPFIIEMPILFKNNNKKNNSKKEFKEYHLCSIQNQLYILKKIEGKNKNTINKNINKNKIYIKHSSLINTEEEIYTDFDILYYNREQNLISLLSKNYDIYNPILFLDFNLVTADLKINKSFYEIYISVLSLENYSFTLQIHQKSSENLFKSLVIHLQRNILSSFGYFNNILSCSIKKNFFQYFYIKNTDFENVAKTGDLLLFKGFDKKSKLQRFYTKSEFDHVALLMRLNNVLFLYEATNENGCKLKSFNEFVNNFCFLSFEKIVYRRLFININSNDINEQLNNVIQKNIQIKAEEFYNLTKNKKYLINFRSIFCGSELKKYQMKNKWEIKKGFSCSSLVYSAYLHMGIINYNKNVNEILPGNFSSNEKLNLNDEFILLPEFIIDFSN